MMDQTQNGQVCSKKSCNCFHHKVTPYALILIGLAVVLQTLNVLSSFSSMLVVGVLLIVIGVMKLGGRKCTCC